MRFPPIAGHASFFAEWGIIAIHRVPASIAMTKLASVQNQFGSVGRYEFKGRQHLIPADKFCVSIDKKRRV
jgi:hypothetical protein